jgi:8-oxo-dGTP pyrophosphatase MutT (NUDIX family)
MKEISAGIIIYRKTRTNADPEAEQARYGAGLTRTNAEIKFLILYHGHNYWNFPKGKIESEEKSFQTALREVKEETGLSRNDLKFNEYFKTYEKFVFWRRLGNKNVKVFKIVIFYLAETKKSQIKVSKEHEGYGWFTYREAMKILNKYKDSQRVLAQAYRFLKNKKKKAI